MISLEPYQQKTIDDFYNWNQQYQHCKFGLYFKQGMGKTITALKFAEKLFENKLIDRAIIVVPPNLVETWAVDMRKINFNVPHILIHYSKLSVLKWNSKKFKENLKKSKEVNILAQLNSRTVLILDESHYIKTPSASRSKWIVKILELTKPWVLSVTATPEAKNILDMWVQCKILDAWTDGLHLSYSAFTLVYADMYNNGNFKIFKGPKNKALLLEGFKNRAVFLSKEDVLDLPPKLYEAYYYRLSTEQKQLFRDLQKDAYAEMKADKLFINNTIHNVLAICSGFAMSRFDDKGEDKRSLIKLKSNPKLELFLELLKSLPQRFIVLCTRHYEIEMIHEFLIAHDKKVSIYHGKIDQMEKDLQKKDFISGINDVFLATTQSAFQGLNLDADCSTVVYFSNTHSLLHREQSEDRIHRLTQTKNCIYIDLICEDALDSVVLSSLKNGKDDIEETFDIFKSMKY